MVKGQAVWRGSWYRRVGKSGGGTTWRNRNTGEVSRTPNGTRLGVEPTNASPYGRNERTKAKAKEDAKRFKQFKR